VKDKNLRKIDLKTSEEVLTQLGFIRPSENQDLLLLFNLWQKLGCKEQIKVKLLRKFLEMILGLTSFTKKEYQ